MARIAKPNNRTSLRFISPDDSSIGLDEKTFKEGWTKYMDTFSEEHLALKEGETPSYYFLRGLTLEGQTRLLAVLRPEDGDSSSTIFDRCFSPEGIAEMRWFLEQHLVGASDHSEVVDILPNGDTETKRYVWNVGEPRPDGLIDSVLADRGLTFNLFMFCTNAARMTEKEKKQ